MLNVLAVLLICFPLSLFVSASMAGKGEPVWVAFVSALLLLLVVALPPALGIALLAGWI